MSGQLVAYNPHDKEQAALLAALRQGESGGNYSVGFGGVDLSGARTDQYGFPQWNGARTSAGPTHAAGAYQFQPGTWKGIASKYGLNFGNKSDQDAGAWYLAQEVYQAKTGGSLDADLDAGKYQTVQNALATTWTSVTGSGGLPGGLASVLGSGISAELSPGATDTGGNTPSLFSDPVGAASAYFVRGGMIVVGVIILGVALWALLNNSAVGKFVPG